jgi:putative ABC transport system substrate-binding protein
VKQTSAFRWFKSAFNPKRMFRCPPRRIFSLCKGVDPDRMPRPNLGGAMRRRDFMTGLGIAAALPAVSRAQQATPTIGFLSTRSPDEAAIHTNAFRSGLEETGYVEGSSVAIEYRWARGDYGKLPAFAAELLSRPLALLVAAGDPAALAAKAAAPSVPLVFLVGGDPERRAFQAD